MSSVGEGAGTQAEWRFPVGHFSSSCRELQTDPAIPRLRFIYQRMLLTSLHVSFLNNTVQQWTSEVVQSRPQRRSWVNTKYLRKGPWGTSCSVGRWRVGNGGVEVGAGGVTKDCSTIWENCHKRVENTDIQSKNGQRMCARNNCLHFQGFPAKLPLSTRSIS